MGGEASVTGSLEFEVFGVGASAEMSVTAGGGMAVSRTKTKEAAHSMSIDVSVNTPGLFFLQKKDANGNLMFTSDNKPVIPPGVVDAYRWNTFYLEPSSSNFQDLFSKVIDQEWLRTSNEPNAAALRQANQQGKAPPCWRILHRVTFVSRVLPKVTSISANPPVEELMSSVNVSSNWQLLQQLAPVIQDKNTWQPFATAISLYLQQKYPQLAVPPYSTAIIKMAADFYAVPTPSQ
eukprot:TRINITY_DN61773_c0_g1_i1.p1 TRINITY_DN61773_c0_g1~~TRINITY_DN61773_c0_g1_i1.p1  ORF type:complete len:250 (+),score=40.39 TRINITY_DN61773_c0_g1_i1:47-751(+)